MPTATITEMRQAHRIVCEYPFEVVPLKHGYAGRYLRIDMTKSEVSILPVTQQMKDLWVGGKGFDLWLLFQEISKQTKWDSPENAICMSPGPLGGTTSFPGSGKTLVTSISPSTGSVMDCNVGGFFGPYFKFAGFDAIVIVGKAPEETIVVLDAVKGRITIERAPLESIDAHLVAEELTAMYADDDIDQKNISVVCAGRAAAHARMGVLNFSFYDWRKKTARIKQAGRGGIGTVFRNKQLKALVVKNRGINPAWSITESNVAHLTTPKTISEVKDAAGVAAIRAIIEQHGNDAENVIVMMQDVQKRFGHLPRTALDEITRVTLTPTSYLYHIATFIEGFSLEPGAASAPIAAASASPRLTPQEQEWIAAEQVAALARSRALLATCTGKRTPVGTAAKATAAAGTGAATAATATAGATAKPKFLAGAIRTPKPAIVPPGATLRSIIDDIGGGMATARPFKAAQIGGPSGPFVTSTALDQPVDFATLTPVGSLTGPDRLTVYDESACMVDVARGCTAYLLSQSCGKCTPCREGLSAVTATLDRILAGKGCPDDLAFIDETCATMHEASFCAFGTWAPNPIQSAIRSFRAEFDEHIRGGKCGTQQPGR